MGDMKIAHFYHIYSDGQYEPAIEEHANALINYGLAEEIKKTFFLGLIGKDKERKKDIMKYFKSRELRPVIVMSADEGFEMLTMDKIREYIKKHDGYVLYAHSKGAYNPEPVNIAWRSSMCYFNVVRWKEMVEKLKIYDVAGCHWLTKDNNETMRQKNDPHKFFGGTYWWARVEYLRTLPPLEYDHRWCAEHWIGENPNVLPYDANPGWPGVNNNFVTKWRNQ